ncbi:unnamed protein product [Adineta steineri]|uniref:Signal peptidase complex subunit 3 n=1 Tax=Adineta steineri TaxID=433720 RepID=A0A813N506_9BILA|nr:unnamed protein product [Adineta steineri]
MTDINSVEYQSASSRICDEGNSSFLLNQSNVPMDVDIDDDDEIIPSPSTKINGHRKSSYTIENGNNDEQEDKEDVFHLGNPQLNKSFDVLPQIKDDNIPSVDSIVDNSAENIDGLDLTVELPNNNNNNNNNTNEFDFKHSPDSNTPKSISNMNTPTGAQALLSNQFSLEYPYVIPQPQENIHSPSSPNPLETVTALTKNMKLNVNKSLEGQEQPSTPTFNTDKTFDTNTFVLKKKERRKATTPASDNSFNTLAEDNTIDLCNKQSPFNAPSTPLDTAVTSRPATGISSSQQPSMDPVRIIECVEQYYRILFRVCECTEELKQELRQVKSERDQMSEDLINAENAYTDVKKRNEKLKLIINEHKMNTETLKRFSEESVRYTEEQKQKYAVLKQHAQEKLNEANSEIERLRKTHTSEMEGVQTQLRYAQLRVQSLEQEIKSVKQELEQKKKENIELTNICDELLATNKRYRLNTLFAFTLTVLAVLTAGVFVSTYFEQYHETVGISVNKPIVKHMTDFQANRKKNDLGIVQLNMDMNLNPLFDWNVKQLFLYLIAEYVTPANSLNQVILWDKIIRRGENANINIRDLATKYYFWDDGENLRSNNVTLTLAWNIISNAGRLIHVRADGAHSFIFPDQYTTSRVANSKTSGQE